MWFTVNSDNSWEYSTMNLQLEYALGSVVAGILYLCLVVTPV